MGSKEAPPTDGRNNMWGATAAMKHVINVNNIPDVAAGGLTSVRAHVRSMS